MYHGQMNEAQGENYAPLPEVVTESERREDFLEDCYLMDAPTELDLNLT